MKIIVDLAHDSIDVVQAVFAAYHANTPRMPLALGESISSVIRSTEAALAAVVTMQETPDAPATHTLGEVVSDAIAKNTPQILENMKVTRSLVEDLAAAGLPPAEAKPKRGRKPATTVTPAVPANTIAVVELAVPPPPPPPPAAETYEEFLKWISGQLMANTLDAGKLEAARKSVGAETLFELSQKPELIPQMRKALES